MQPLQITKENWTTARFKESELIAFVAYGATPGDQGEQFIDQFNLIVSNLDYIEISEQTFLTLEEALKSLNERFGHWHMIDLSIKNEGGCGSCAAH